MDPNQPVGTIIRTDRSLDSVGTGPGHTGAHAQRKDTKGNRRRRQPVPASQQPVGQPRRGAASRGGGGVTRSPYGGNASHGASSYKLKVRCRSLSLSLSLSRARARSVSNSGSFSRSRPVSLSRGSRTTSRGSREGCRLLASTHDARPAARHYRAIRSAQWTAGLTPDICGGLASSCRQGFRSDPSGRTNRANCVTSKSRTLSCAFIFMHD